MEAVTRGVMSGVIAYSIHYTMTRAYTAICLPEGVLGFVKGLISTGSPVCQSMLTVASHAQVSYSSFVLLGVSRVLVDLIPVKVKQGE
jgi:hypothetical protein